MYSEMPIQNEKNILLHISDLLLEKGFISEKERNAMKSIIVGESKSTVTVQP